MTPNYDGDAVAANEAYAEQLAAEEEARRIAEEEEARRIAEEEEYYY